MSDAPGALRRAPAERRPSAMGSICGLALVVCGGGLGLSALVDLTDGAGDTAALAALGAAAGLAGALLRRSCRIPDRVPPKAALRAAATALLTMIVTSALAYLATGAITTVDDALIEGTAGFTTTALTVLGNPETQGNGVLFWRAITQWIGGFAGLATVIAVLPFLGVGGPAPTKAKAPSGAKHLHSPHVRRILRQYLELYATLSAIGAGLYLLGGMGPFDAVTYAFTTISTGGFANHAGSFTYFGSPTLEWMGVAGMFLGGLSLALAWCALRGRHQVVLRSREFAAYCGLIGGATLVIALVESPGATPMETLRLSAFTATSAVSTTGHWAADWAAWGSGPQLLIVALVGVGAMSGSSGGGFRVARAMALVSFLHREVIIQLRPHAVQRVRVGDEVIEDRMVSRMLGYQVLFLITAAGGMVGLALSGADVVTATAGAVSSLATFGPAPGELGVGRSIAGLNDEALLVVGTLMFAGKVELYPVLDALAAGVTRPARAARRALRRRAAT
ncbi:MAG: TrkH family potassium uptake protein [Microthrixaceae bacterium]|nr:TrkH family potassium uptake protein [Microthrixaceae bacterium]